MLLHGHAHAAGQRAAAHRHEDDVDALELPHDLQPHRPRTLDPAFALAVVDEPQPLGVRESRGPLLGVVEIVADVVNRRAEELDLRALQRIRTERQKHVRRDAGHVRGPGHALPVIAGRGGDHASRAARRSTAQEIIERTPPLERGDRRDRFVLDPQIACELAREEQCAIQWRGPSVRGESFGRAMNVHQRPLRTCSKRATSFGEKTSGSRRSARFRCSAALKSSVAAASSASGVRESMARV